MTEVSQAKPLRYINKGATDQAARTLKLWRHRPKIFVYDAMGVILDEWQEECAVLYTNHQRLGMVASKGPGKTGFLALMGIHFMCCFFRPKIAALSVTKDHLKSNLWAELHMWRDRSTLVKKTINEGASRMTLVGHEEYSFIDARSYAKSADEREQASALAGLHSDNVGFLIDEAGTIPDAVLATADAALSTGDSDTKRARLIVTANPERPQGMIYRAAMGRSIQEWAIYRISGDPDDPKRAPRVSAKWAQEQIDTYGREHPWVKVNVLAEYPDTAADKLLSEEEVHQAMNRDIEAENLAGFQLRMGVDVARGGADSTVLFRRRGKKAFAPKLESSALKAQELASLIAFECDKHMIERTWVDNTGGYGSGVVDNMEFFPHLDVQGVIYNSRAQDQRYYNKRTEMWMRMRDWVRAGGCLPNDPNLMQELIEPEVYFINGKVRLEEKEQIKQRLGRSPDRADALAQTFADPEQPSYAFEGGGGPGLPHHMSQGRFISKEDQLPTSYRPNPRFKS